MTNNIDVYMNDPAAFARDLCDVSIQPWQENIMRSLCVPKDTMTATEVRIRQREWASRLQRVVIPRLEIKQEIMVADMFSFTMKKPPRTMKRNEWYQMQSWLRFARRKVAEKMKALEVTGHYERLALYGHSMLEIVA